MPVVKFQMWLSWCLYCSLKHWFRVCLWPSSYKNTNHNCCHLVSETVRVGRDIRVRLSGKHSS